MFGAGSKNCVVWFCYIQNRAGFTLHLTIGCSSRLCGITVGINQLTHLFVTFTITSIIFVVVLKARSSRSPTTVLVLVFGSCSHFARYDSTIESGCQHHVFIATRIIVLISSVTFFIILFPSAHFIDRCCDKSNSSPLQQCNIFCFLVINGNKYVVGLVRAASLVGGAASAGQPIENDSHHPTVVCQDDQ